MLALGRDRPGAERPIRSGLKATSTLRCRHMRWSTNQQSRYLPRRIWKRALFFSVGRRWQRMTTLEGPLSVQEPTGQGWSARNQDLDLFPLTSALLRRYRPGDIPNSRVNALLNAAVDSYPTRSATFARATP